MVKRYITQGNLLMEVNRADGGCWVNLVAPTLEECVQIAQEFQIDLADVRAALDDEESSRVDVSNEYSLILFDVPSVEYRHQREAYTTIPLGLLCVHRCFVTPGINSRVKHKGSRLCFTLLYSKRPKHLLCLLLTFKYKGIDPGSAGSFHIFQNIVHKDTFLRF